MLKIDDNAFWTLLWLMIFTSIVAVIAISTYYFDSRNEYMTKLISEGADPIAVMCAFDDPRGNNPTCVLTSMPKHK